MGLVGWDQGLIWGVICACRVLREGVRGVVRHSWLTVAKIVMTGIATAISTSSSLGGVSQLKAKYRNIIAHLYAHLGPQGHRIVWAC